MMDRWARIEDSKVVEIVSENPEGRYHASLFFMPCSMDVQQGWIYQEGGFVPPAQQQEGEA